MKNHIFIAFSQYSHKYRHSQGYVMLIKKKLFIMAGLLSLMLCLNAFSCE